MPVQKKIAIGRKHEQTRQELAELNREMALKLISLANKTGDIEALIEAVQALRSAQDYYSPETTPVENARILKKLGDILFKVGKEEHHERGLKHAVLAYRGAITLASLLGEHELRSEAKRNYVLALEYTGEAPVKPILSLKGAA